MRFASKLFIGYILIILSTTIGYAQSKDAIIKDIKSSFQLINKDQSLKVIKLENEEFLESITDGGGILTGYFKDNKLCKIKVWVGLSYGVKEFEYYLKDDKVFFIYEKENDFKYDTKTGVLDNHKLNLGFEGRYYLKQGNLIDIIKNGKKRFDGDVTKKYITALLNDVTRYKKLLHSRQNLTSN